MIDAPTRAAFNRFQFELDDLDYRMSEIRRKRDAIALRLIDEGAAWREVVEVMGFSNLFNAALKRDVAVLPVAPERETPA